MMMVVIDRRKTCVTRVLQGCQNGVARVLRRCSKGWMVVIVGREIYVTRILQQCRKGVTPVESCLQDQTW
jgi:hypothetical protein